ncbi:hypothetical protein GOQ30_00010 [Flavobacterium sp. TP390]|uniref:Immunity protein 22 n=1 Tax=Flavobacterium profundi TaxID=1774945 RepID=A0A6I4IDQ4_9FLAO|nr:immunity 22 family protein [Flavobacterium profundi]MVO07540.1 hypothetical protein [Flavobacterium profundi]
MKNKVVCVWIGEFDSKENFYNKYFSFNYEDDDISQFVKDSELEYYDEDFIESWWFEKLSISELKENKEVVLDSEYFFDDLIVELSKQNISTYNTITFLFGEKGENASNQDLFDYESSNDQKTIRFVFKKEYQK